MAILINHSCTVQDGPFGVNILVDEQCAVFFGEEISKDLAREFEETHPNLKIQFVPKEKADIVFFEDGEFSALKENGSLLMPAGNNQNETKEERLAVQLISFMDLFFYNIDILKEAGCDRPPKTHAEFLAAARAVAKRPAKSEYRPLAIGLSPADPMALRRDIFPWIWTAGGDIFQTGAEQGTLSAGAAGTIAFFGEMAKEGLLAPDSFTITGTQRLEEFAAGKTAMMTASAKDIAWLKQNAPALNFGITSVPAAAQGKTRLGLLGIYAGITAASAIPDEAWKFLVFIEGKSKDLAEAARAVPGTFPGVFQGDYISADPLYSKAWDIFENADIAETPFTRPEEEAILREKLAEAMRPSLQE